VKKNPSYVLVVSAFLFASSVFATQPPDLGHFKGLAFSSATDRHPLEINGGSLVRCVDDPTSSLLITNCEVENGSIEVSGTDLNRLNVKLLRVAVLRTRRDTPTRNYYFHGLVDLQIGAELVTSPVSVTITIEDPMPNRLRGFIDLPDQAVRNSIEAYLVP
jgi:hypothetical protein